MNEKSEEETGKENPIIHGNIEIKDITFGYKKNTPVIKNVSISAKKTQKIAFVGSTGAGKTTIANLLNRFYDVDSGIITIDGSDIKKFDKSYLRQNIAVVLQDTHLFTGSIMENVRYGRLDASDEEVIERYKFFKDLLMSVGIDKENAEIDAFNLEHALSGDSFEQLKIFLLSDNNNVNSV